MVKKGDLVEFKPGLFGVEVPKNYGIFIKRFRQKRSKKHIVELYTLKGIQQTSQANLINTSLYNSVPLTNNNLPESKIIRERLEVWISEISIKKEKMEHAINKSGKPTERGLWVKLSDKGIKQDKFTIEELASLWYEIDERDISKSRIKKLNEELKTCLPHGQGFFEIEGMKPQLFIPISQQDYKNTKQEISELGQLRNLLFEMVEVALEDSEDEDETEIVRLPIVWSKVSLSSSLVVIVKKISKIMIHFVENDSWPEIGLGNTHIYAIDGFSLRKFLSHLIEDWINEGRTSYSDAFVKFLIRSGTWSDSDALLAISKRNVKLAPNFTWEIDNRIEGIASKFDEPSTTPEIIKDRMDLQHLECYTIDPPTAKDFDDAISLEEKKDGYVLWVHIADVAHYVQKDSSLDLHAKSKATSVYLPTKTLPMLPTHLSDNLCSLRENVPRLAMSVEIHYNLKGEKQLPFCRIHNSVILVEENLSYDFVNTAIENHESPFENFYNFSRLLQKYRHNLALETDDVRLELGGQMALTVKTSSKSTKMIETFMVAANETVGEILQKKKIPVIYRNHPLPDKTDVDKFNAQAKVIYFNHYIEYPNFHKRNSEDEETGQSLFDVLAAGDKLGSGGSITFSLGSGTDFAKEMEDKLKKEKENEEDEIDLGTPIVNGLAQLTEDEREQILEPFREGIAKIEKIEDEDQKKLAYLTVLKTLSRALYGAGNMGHFGLGSISYLHFTSPIRRYPDIIAHRVCKSMIADQDLAYSAEEIDEIALKCTEQSEIAEKLEKTIIGAGFSFLTRNPDYNENRQGIVVSIFGGGVFVLLPNGIEARIPLYKITSRPTFVDDYETLCFVGSRSDFKIQDEVTPENWKELLLDENDEPIEVITKIGDRILVEYVGWNHVEGKVEAAPVTIYKRTEEGFELKEFEADLKETS